MKKLFTRNGYHQLKDKEAEAPREGFKNIPAGVNSPKDAEINRLTQLANKKLEGRTVSPDTDAIMEMMIASNQTLIVRLEHIMDKILDLEAEVGTTNVKVDRLYLRMEKLEQTVNQRTPRSPVPPLSLPPARKSPSTSSDSDSDSDSSTKGSRRGSRILQKISSRNGRASPTASPRDAKKAPTNSGSPLTQRDPPRPRAGSAIVRRPRTARNDKK